MKIKIKTIKGSDPDFLISNGYMLHSRASISISLECPVQIQNQILYAISKGWVTVQAHVPEQELVWEHLNK